VTTPTFFRHSFAEWKPVTAQVRRTRLGLWLAAIVVGALWIAGRPDGVFLPTLALGVALTTAVTVAGALAGREAARVTALTLRHPASPLALAAGRWLGVVLLAALVTLLASVGAAWRIELGWRDGAAAAFGASCAALPIAACALAAARLGGGVLEWLFLAFLLLLSTLLPEATAYVPDGVLREATLALLVTLPAVWRYRLLAAGDPVAWLHAASWTAAGLLVTAESLRRRAP